MSEKFSLKWNDFQSNVSRTFSQLRSEEEFFNVSLVSDDQKMMSAHKLVLSASSPYFKHILTHNKHSHPLLCLDGVRSGELQSVLDYIYQGEVQIYQEQLDRFLEVAQKFQLEGLNSRDTKEEALEDKLNTEVEHDFSEQEPPQDQRRSQKTVQEPPQVQRRSQKTVLNTQRSHKTEDSPIVSLEPDAGNIAEVDAKINQHIVKDADGTYSCGMCGKKSGHIGHLKNHIETHMEGLSYPCQSCDKTFRSRNSFKSHRSQYHRFQVETFSGFSQI